MLVNLTEEVKCARGSKWWSRRRNENEEKEKVGKKEEKKKRGRKRHDELLFVGYRSEARFRLRGTVIGVMAHIQNALDG